MGWYVLMVLVQATLAVAEYATIGSFYQSTGASSGLEDGRNPAITKALLRCDREEDCQTVVKAKGEKEVDTIDSRPTRKEASTCEFVFLKEKNDTMMLHEIRKRFSIQSLPEKLPPGFCQGYFSPPQWLVFQRRIDNTVSFNRRWKEYKEGFGDFTGNFWLGLEYLRFLAPPSQLTTLRIKLRHSSDPSKMFYAEYDDFSVSNEADGYRLSIGSYMGNTGDSLRLHDQMKFSTKDKDNDVSAYHCGKLRKSGWWFTSCYAANLNGVFPPFPYHGTNRDYMTWIGINGNHGGLYYSEMALGCN